MVDRASQPAPLGSKLEPISEPENPSHLVARHDEDLRYASEYHYRLLPRNRKAIRLFRLIHAIDVNNQLQGEIIEAEFIATPRIARILRRTGSTDNDETLQYEALSWYWGIGPKDCALMICEDQKYRLFRISGRLAVALKQLRLRDKDKLLWIDAICINQNDFEERAQQVRLMAQIYSMANQVCISLGEGDDDSTSAIRFIKEEIMKLDDTDSLLSNRRIEQWQSLLNLMQRHWFSRRWVIQEIALAREATIYCGLDSVRWQDFAVAVEMFVETQAATRLLSRTTQGGESLLVIPDWFNHVSELGATLLVQASAKIFRQDRPALHASQGALGPPTLDRRKLLNLEHLVSSLFVFEATEPRDVIYSMLSIAKDTYPVAPSIVPDPMNMALEVFSDFSEAKPYNVNYEQSYADACKDFVLFCMQRGFEKNPSCALDVLCRPWAPDERKHTIKKEDTEYRHVRYRVWGPGTKPWIRFKRRSESGQLVEDTRTAREYWRDVCTMQAAENRPRMPIAIPPPLNSEALPLPSWVCRLSNTPFARIHPSGGLVMAMERRNADCLVGSPLDASRPYSACQTVGLNSNNIKFSRRASLGHYSLYLDGFIIDVVKASGEVSRDGLIPQEWFKLGGWEDPLKTEPPAEFWRTLVADRGKDNQNPPYYYILALKESVRRVGMESGSVDTKELVRSDKNWVIAEFYRRVQAVTWNRRLIRTERGRLGMVQNSVQAGDLVCILFGCSVPVVLRRHRKSAQDIAAEELEDRKAPTKNALRNVVIRCKEAYKSKMKYRSRREWLAPEELAEIKRETVRINKLMATWRKHKDSRTLKDAKDAKGADDPQENRARPLTDVDAKGDSSTPEDKDDKWWHYEFLGECYIHGAMDGEAMEQRILENIPYRTLELR